MKDRGREGGRRVLEGKGRNCKGKMQFSSVRGQREKDGVRRRNRSEKINGQLGLFTSCKSLGLSASLLSKTQGLVYGLASQDELMMMCQSFSVTLTASGLPLAKEDHLQVSCTLKDDIGMNG